MKCHRVKRQNCFAGAVHQFNLLLEPARGTHRAELVGGVDHHRYGIEVLCCDPTNIADKSGVAHVRTSDFADTDNVTGRGD
jgi:hypothetical protein